MLGLMLLVPFCGYSQLPPTVQDCAGAIPVCQPVYSTILSYTGHGNVYPEIHNTSVCPLCMDGEKNDVFYVITVQNDGILRFKLSPNNPSNDYDWELFNMTNAECSQLYNNASFLTVSCNSYGVTGINDSTGILSLWSNNKNCNGPFGTNGPPFNKDLTVYAGETYLLNISNWSPTQQQGYTLDFSSSTASIFDMTPPLIDSIQEQISCSGATELFVRFSENIKCGDIFHHPEKFSITGGSGGTHTITDVISDNCLSGAPQSPSCTLIVSPPLYGGSYILNIVGDIRDLCDNLMIQQGYPFQLTELNAPAAYAGNDTIIPYGAIVNLHGSGSGGNDPYTYHWEPASMLVDPNLRVPTTLNVNASTVFTVTLTDSIGCHGNDDVLVSVVGGPLVVGANATPTAICFGQSSNLVAIPSGGSGNYSYSWTSNPSGFTSTLQNPVVFPDVTTTYTVAINDGYSNTENNVTVTVHPLPVANAGSNTSIPYGTNVTLHGSATIGSGSYSYYWTSSPAGYTSPLKEPTFINLTVTTVFELTVIDQVTGCEAAPVQVIVTVTGGPLGVNPVVSNPVICNGNSTQLFSTAGGGSGTYSYSWSSYPEGFASTEPNPVVSPDTTTTYYLFVSDGYNETNGSVSVTVNPLPTITLGPNDTLVVCVKDTVRLDAGNPGSVYYWSNGATSQSIRVGTAGIGYDLQKYSVKVTNQNNCIDSASIVIVFTYDACVGIIRNTEGPGIRIFPNPGNGLFTVRADNFAKAVLIEVYNLLGERTFKQEFEGSRGQLFERTIDLTDLAKGAYFLKLTSGEYSHMGKIIIN
jgi:hypothetical protein